MNKLPKLENPLVLRTTFSNPTAWKNFCEEVVKPVDGFDVYLSFVDNAEYKDVSIEHLKALISEENDGFLFIVDQKTLEDVEYPVLVVDLVDEPYASFRAVARQVGSIAANLSIANMDFFDFANCVDDDGVFRKFPDSPPQASDAAFSEVPNQHLYVGNLPFDATDELLRQTFSSFGRVVSAQVAKDSEGRFRGFARVEMENIEAAQKSKDQLNGQVLNGRAILVAFDGPQWPQ